MGLKWYFAISESSLEREDHDWRGLIRVAVESAHQKTRLRPNMLYDGQPNEFTDELRRKGVRIIPYRVSFYRELEQHQPHNEWYLKIASGAFLRTEIPLIETDDDFVLYTDCDVMFLKDIPSLSCHEPFIVAPEAEPDALSGINTGVMLMNVRSLKDSFSKFREFIGNNLERFNAFDQTAYQLFYPGQFGALSPQLNWRPYWWYNPDAVVLHWHGPKPIVVRRLLDDPNSSTWEVWRHLFSRDPDSYRQYLSIWDGFSTHSIEERDRLEQPITPVALGDKRRLTHFRENVQGQSRLSKSV
jgi:hypothetical protein